MRRLYVSDSESVREVAGVSVNALPEATYCTKRLIVRGCGDTAVCKPEVGQAHAEVGQAHAGASLPWRALYALGITRIRLVR